MRFWHDKWEGAQPKEADCLDQSRMCSVLGACRSAHYPFNGGLLVFCEIGITSGASGVYCINEIGHVPNRSILSHFCFLCPRKIGCSCGVDGI